MNTHYCEVHGIEFDMEEHGGCPDCIENWIGIDERYDRVAVQLSIDYEAEFGKVV